MTTLLLEKPTTDPVLLLEPSHSELATTQFKAAEQSPALTPEAQAVLAKMNPKIAQEVIRHAESLDTSRLH